MLPTLWVPGNMSFCSEERSNDQVRKRDLDMIQRLKWVNAGLYILIMFHEQRCIIEILILYRKSVRVLCYDKLWFIMNERSYFSVHAHFCTSLHVKLCIITICLSTCLLLYVWAGARVSVCRCVRVCMCTCVSVHVYWYTFKITYVCLSVCMYVCMK